MLPQISEIRSESLGEDGIEGSSRLGIGIGESRFSGSGLHFNSWNNSSRFSDNVASLSRPREDDVKLFPGGQVVAIG